MPIKPSIEKNLSMKQFAIHAREILYFLFARMPLTAYGRLKGNLVKTNWGRGLNNFGDCLHPYMLRHFLHLHSNKVRVLQEWLGASLRMVASLKRKHAKSL